MGNRQHYLIYVSPGGATDVSTTRHCTSPSVAPPGLLWKSERRRPSPGVGNPWQRTSALSGPQSLTSELEWKARPSSLGSATSHPSPSGSERAIRPRAAGAVVPCRAGRGAGTIAAHGPRPWRRLRRNGDETRIERFRGTWSSARVRSVPPAHVRSCGSAHLLPLGLCAVGSRRCALPARFRTGPGRPGAQDRQLSCQLDGTSMASSQVTRHAAISSNSTAATIRGTRLLAGR